MDTKKMADTKQLLRPSPINLRVAAFVVDILTISFIWTIIAAAFRLSIVQSMYDLPFLFYLVSSFVITSLFATTPGKRLFHLKVVDKSGQKPSWKRIFIREIPAKFLSAFIFSCGFLWVFLSPRRRSWHDLLSGTHVEYYKSVGMLKEIAAWILFILSSVLYSLMLVTIIITIYSLITKTANPLFVVKDI